DVALTAGHLEAMLASLQDAGATVLTFTLPDLASVVPAARIVRARLRAYNQAIREVGERTGAIVVDIDAEPVSRDPRLWSVDRLHASPLGHERITGALCHALGLDAERWWAEPLPPLSRRRAHTVVAAE